MNKYSMIHKTLILSKSDVRKLVDLKSAIRSVEDVFREYGMGRTQMPPKIYIHLKRYSGDFRAMPAYVEKLDRCVLKWVNVHPKNRDHGLPAVMAVIILSDPATGLPLCVMEGAYPTSLRTGAAAAIAAKYLARKNSSSVGMVGCGAQARLQLGALMELFKIKEVSVWGKERVDADCFISEMKCKGVRFTVARTVKECVKDKDIIVTTTPSRKPIVKLAWVKKGAHINAIGADAQGKEELDVGILKQAKVVVDSWEQASHSGEINVPVSKGLIKKRDIYADIGEIVSGKKSSRTDDAEITVFDSTGLAIQDAAMADLIYKNALKRGLGRSIKFI